jgi:hypothetical protein
VCDTAPELAAQTPTLAKKVPKSGRSGGLSKLRNQKIPTTTTNTQEAEQNEASVVMMVGKNRLVVTGILPTTTTTTNTDVFKEVST